MNRNPLPLHSRKHDRKTQYGSVLLLTLMVVSLLMIVVLAFVTMVRLELRSVIQHQELLQARSNAKLGAEMALARLQEVAGPDTRSSFPSSAAANLNVDPTNRHWTGVQDTALFIPIPESSDLQLNPRQGVPLGWLVSAPIGSDPDPTRPTLDSEGRALPGHTLLVGPGSVSAPEDHVAAPVTALQNPEGSDFGSIAWWADGENDKTQVNLPDPFRTDGNPDTDRWRWLVSQRIAAEAIFPGADPENPIHQQDLSRASLVEQLALARLDETVNIRDHFHDVTVHAHALPSNPVRGGLKRDLTAVLEETAGNTDGLPGGPQYDKLLSYQSSRLERLAAETDALPTLNPGLPDHVWNALRAIRLRPEQRNPSLYQRLLFPPFSDMRLAWDQAGPSWAQLLSWTTLFDRQAVGGSLRPDRQLPDIQNAMPVIAKMNLGVYHTFDFPRIRLHFIPAIVLWNPYSTPLAAREYHMIADIAPDSTHGGSFGVSFQVSHPNWNTGDRFWTPPYQMDFVIRNENSFRFRLAAAEIPAGGTVIYTLPEHTEFQVISNDAQAGYTFWQDRVDRGTKGYVEDKWVDLTPGLHDGGGYSFYVEEPDIRPKIAHSAGIQRSTYLGGYYNEWSHAGAPLYFPGPTSWRDSITDADITASPALNLREMCFNENGLDLNRGWRIHRTAAIMIRGMGSPRRRQNYWSHTSLGRARLILGGDEDEVEVGSTRPERRPWSLVDHLHNNVPAVLHDATPHFHPGLFPEITGAPPSFDPSAPFRFNSPGYSPGFPLWGVSWGLRLPDNMYEYAAASGGGTELNLEAPISWLAHYNPTANYQTRSGLGRVQSYDRGSFEFDAPANYIGGFTIDPAYFDLSPHTPNDRNAFIGHSDGVTGGMPSGEIPRAILFEPPRSPNDVVGIASLAHANLQSHGNPGNGDSDLGSRLTRNRMLNNATQPAYGIGTSLQPPLMHGHKAVRSFFATPHYPGDDETPPLPIPYAQERLSGQAFGGNGNDTYVAFRAQYDHAWIFNHMLWDDFIFTPESNSRLIWQNMYAERDLDLSASRLHIQGAFNVNSTSVDAWRALLYSLLDVELPNISGRSEATPDVERIPFARFLSPYSPAFSQEAGDRYDDQENFTGYRRLSLAEVDRLAEEIVQEVEARGPFRSMADFVNRRLLRPEEDIEGHRIKGALQAAIDRSGINDTQTSVTDPTSAIASSDFPWNHSNGTPLFRGYDLQAASVATNHSAPGYFTQADILARIGPVLTTRSDTFTIRALGTTPAGAKAMCEVVVKRSGSYLDPADPPERHPDHALDMNQVLGRRFEIIRFRWLNPEDV